METCPRVVAGVWWMLALSPSLPSAGNQVDAELTIGGVNGADYTGDFVYTNLESTSHWQIHPRHHAA